MSDLKQMLTSIYTQHKQLTPQLVVDEARDEQHPLHHRFEWDNHLAGEAYRRIQAAELIRSVRIVYATNETGEPRSVRAFSSLHDSADTRTGYMPTEQLVENDVTRRILLKQLERDISALTTKYGHLEEFADIIANTIRKGA